MQVASEIVVHGPKLWTQDEWSVLEGLVVVMYTIGSYLT
jgi:hypothetical protein